VIRKDEMNPIVRPADVKPSMEGYRVRGAFNPGAIVFGHEILLLLREAEIEDEGADRKQDEIEHAIEKEAKARTRERGPYRKSAPLP